MNDNLFSIGDVSRILGITRKIILNYETCGLVAPDVKMVLMVIDIIQLIPLQNTHNTSVSKLWISTS